MVGGPVNPIISIVIHNNNNINNNNNNNNNNIPLKGFQNQFLKCGWRKVVKIFVGKYNSFYADDLETMR